MIRRNRVSIVVGAAVIMSAAALGAQQPTPPTSKSISSCSSGRPGGGPDCAVDRRLLIDVRLRGAGAPEELGMVVSIGANSGGAFRLTPNQATSADSAVYGVIVVERDSSGEYRIEQSLQGSRVTNSRNCSGYGTGSGDDLQFGAFLAIESAQLARCAQSFRERIRTK
jgi:hypothetical protein